MRLSDGDSFHFVSSRLNLIARQPVERFPKVSFVEDEGIKKEEKNETRGRKIYL